MHAVDLLYGCAGASAGNTLFLGSLYSIFIISGSFPFHKGNRTCRAGRETVTQAVTVVITQEPSFPVYHTDGSLMASVCADPTAVALIFIYLDDSSYHFFLRSKAAGILSAAL